MKKLLIFSLFILSFNQSYSQQSAVTNAALYHKEGQLDKALEEINQAAQHEKTKDDAKTWYWRAVIYQGLIETQEEKYKSLDGNPHKQAFESYQKAIELDPKQGEYYNLSKKNLENLFALYLNKGVGEYETGAYQEAVESFQISQKINPDDPKAYLYACYAAEELERSDLIKTYLSELDRLGYKDVQTYLYKINVANRDGNAGKALELSKHALVDFPADQHLLQEQTNLYIKEGQRAEAIQNLNLLISLDPANIEYVVMLGIQHDAAGDKKQALHYYEQTLSKNPDHFLANYNSAIIYYEKAKALNEEVHKMPMDKYHTEGKKKESEEEQAFDKALDLANKALTLTTDESDKKNINLLISEIKKVQKDEQVYKSLHKN